MAFILHLLPGTFIRPAFDIRQKPLVLTLRVYYIGHLIKADALCGTACIRENR
jgi:hypothetical protein